jgi:hypothetical protein
MLNPLAIYDNYTANTSLYEPFPFIGHIHDTSLTFNDSHSQSELDQRGIILDA